MSRFSLLTKIIAPLFLLLFLIPILVWGQTATGNKTDGYRAPVGVNSAQITIWDDSCRTVTNTSVRDYFVPTRSQLEWDAFVNFIPTNVTVGGCAACTVGDCCNLGTGQFMPAGTVIGTCGKCTGSSNTSVNQTSSEDLGNQCATGAAGTATSCQSNNCSGTSRACGFLASGTTCRASAGICDMTDTCTGSAFACPSDGKCTSGTYWNGSTCASGFCATGSFNSPASGSCSRVAVDTNCSGVANTCTGGTVNRYEYASVNDNVWNSSSWVAKTTTVNCNMGAWTCNGNTPRRLYYGCNTSGACNVTSTTYQNGTACTGAENSRCVAGLSTCQNLCSNGIDDDGNGLTDALDPACGAQCTAGDCCNLGTGQFMPAGTVIGTCGKCTGSSNTSVNQTSSEDLGNQCATGAAGTATSCQSNNCSGTSRACGFLASGTTCRASAGICDRADTCTGASFACPSDAKCTSGTYWNGSSCVAGNCATSGSCASPIGNTSDGSCNPYYTTQICNGTVNTCTGTITNQPCYGSSGQVWFTSAWRATTSTYRCGVAPAHTCSGTQPQGYAIGCNGSGTCSVNSTALVNVGAACTGTTPVCSNGACVACTSGDCCDTATKTFRPNSYKCIDGTWSNPAVGSCSRSKTDRYCSGSSSACVGATQVVYDYAASGQVWNGTSAYVAASGTVNCGFGTYYCSTIYLRRPYYGCNGSGSCNTSTAAGYVATATCSASGTTETTSTCMAGNSTCTNLCGDGEDNDFDGYIDGQDSGCGGCEQCTSGACCNTNTGCICAAGTYFNGSSCVAGPCRAANGACDAAETCTGASAVCPADGVSANTQVCETNNCDSGAAVLTGTNGACTYSFNNRRCDGTNKTCIGSYVASGTPCNVKTSGTVYWDGTFPATTATYRCGVSAANSCSGTQPQGNALGCGANTGTCSVQSAVKINVGSVCSGGTPYCSNGTCVACTLNSHCPSSRWESTSCSGYILYGYYRTYSCSSGTCTSSLSGLTQVADCTACSVACMGGLTYCPAVGTCSNGYTLGCHSCRCCLAGHYCVNGAESPCNPGTYQPNTCRTSCFTCNAGYYCPGGGTTQISCGAGRSSNAGAASYAECFSTVCGPGSYFSSTIGCLPLHPSVCWTVNSCAPCDAGQWGNGTSCFTCSVGTYQPNYGSGSCINCPTGWTTSGAGSTSSGQCNVKVQTQFHSVPISHLCKNVLK